MVIVGNEKNNALSGGSSSDTLEGLGGNDTLDGKDGIDTAIYGLPPEMGGKLVQETVGQYVYIRHVDGGETTEVLRIWRSGALVKVEDLRPGSPLGLDTLRNIEKLQLAGWGETRFPVWTANLDLVTTLTSSGIRGSIFADTIDVATLSANAGWQTARGGLGNDTIIAGHVASTLLGEDGDDRLLGRSANDWFYGGAGNDTIDGKAGIDRASYVMPELARDTEFRIDVTGNTAVISRVGAGGTAEGLLELVRNTATGRVTVTDLRDGSPLGIDTLTNVELVLLETGGFPSGASVFQTAIVRQDHRVVGSDFADVFAVGTASSANGGRGDDRITGSAIANWLGGDDGNDTLRGMGGDDRLTGGRGDNLLDGGAGFDMADYVEERGVVTIKLAAGTVTGRDPGTGTDTLRSVERVRGSEYNDVFDARGFSATSLNRGSAGDLNEFQGLGGNDRIFGNGSTRISYEQAEAGVQVDVAAGTASGREAGVQVDVAAGTASGREAGVQVDVAAGTASGREADDVARIGQDTFSGVNAVRGSAHADTLSGSNNRAGTVETFSGMAGDDWIDGRGGIDRVRYDDPGQFEEDRFGGALGVSINLAPGVVKGRDAAARAEFGADALRGIEQAVGSEGADTFTAAGFGGASAANVGEGPANLFEGRGGNDTITGNGHTTASYASAAAGVTVDLLAKFSQGDASVGRDTLGAGVVGIVGSAHADSLTGNAAANTIEGGLGADIIRGGGGADRLSGGAGNDTFVFAAKTESTVAARDAITDFQAGAGAAVGDVFRFAIADFEGPISYLGTAAFTKTGAFEARLAVSGSSKIVQIDGNGDGRIDMEIDVTGMSGALKAANFVSDFVI